ncbi:hypothetical protein KIK06_23475 [Nocardiopsis sp. EMB25]|uniref:hypothetical protein n=1 Tax=Nocardiopsis sp. EMB25 TaxID=2835867 RepID=UPI002283D381|nr:hypothetical protein [Nocardiopsis sp. EMB25]MCY9786848.1 hypothetical protein [Nocardiopsis sp. EMB25]
MRCGLACVVSVLALAVAGCGGGEDEAAAVDVPAYEVVKDEGRVTELLSEGVDTEGAEAIIDQVIAENENGWDREHNVQVIAEPDAGMVVCRARWVEDEQSSEVMTGGTVTSEDGEWPVVELDCFE